MGATARYDGSGLWVNNDEIRDDVTRMLRRRFWLTLQNIIDWAL